MRSLTALVILVAVVAGCSSAPADSGSAGGGGGDGVFPPPGVVWFGPAFDATTLSLAERSNQIKQGSPAVAVAKLPTARPASEVRVQVSSGSTSFPPEPVTAANGTDSADLFAIDLSPKALTPNTWIVNFIGPNGRILASGFLPITK